jgi:hypothetical protein
MWTQVDAIGATRGQHLVRQRRAWLFGMCVWLIISYISSHNYVGQWIDNYNQPPQQPPQQPPPVQTTTQPPVYGTPSAPVLNPSPNPIQSSCMFID